MVGGALVNALAFSGSNYLFSMLHSSGSSGIVEERKRHDLAVEQLQIAQAEWSRRRIERLDWINEELRRQHHSFQTFHDVEEAMREYAHVTGKTLDPLGPRPQLPTSIHQAAIKKTARSPSSSWGWPQPALWHTK